MFDFHVHSDRSADGHNSVAEVIAGAQAAGLDGICFTEHWEAQPENERWRPDFSVFEPLPDFAKFGVELGTPHAAPDDARALLASAEFDFVLGSVHCLPDMPDFYWLRPDNGERGEAEKLLREYIFTHLELLKFGDFDSVAHLGYPLRYSGYGLTLTDLRGELTEVFSELARTGKAIECNTAGFVYDEGVHPTLEVLKLWRECGGELVTLGSDSHLAEQVGRHLQSGAEMLREAGFTRYCVFERRKPRYINI